MMNRSICFKVCMVVVISCFLSTESGAQNDQGNQVASAIPGSSLPVSDSYFSLADAGLRLSKNKAGSPGGDIGRYYSRGIDFGGEDQKTLTVALGTVAFAVLVIHDIVSAPSSARRYNEGLSAAINYQENVASSLYTFGQHDFSRAALLSSQARQPVHYKLKAVDDKEKSPSAALFWSLGTTLIPVIAGVLVTDFEHDSRPRNEIGGVAIISGVLLGPSAGHYYSNRIGRGLLSTFLRIGLGAVVLFSLDLHDHT